METVNKKIIVFSDALQTLEESVELFYEYKNIFDKQPTERNGRLFHSMRDSMIQRFEYCTDLFWKVAKIYLENIEKIDLPVNSPRVILREAVTARILSELEGDQCIDMVDSRNKTSHIYHEVTADTIAHEVPGYYKIMKTIIDRMQAGIIKQ